MKAPLAFTALVAAAYLVVAPATADLAAHEYRSWLFAEHGFVRTNPNWYGGHNVPAYSLVFPPLGALLGPRLVGALAAVAAVAVAGPMLRERGRRGELALWLLAAGMLASLWVGRMPFVLGLAFGIAAFWALQRDRTAPALLLAALCGLSSPVAGLFLAIAAVVTKRGPTPFCQAGVAVGAPFVLAVLYPEGGSERFVATAFWPMLALSLAAVWLLGGRWRLAAALNVALLAGAFLVETPVGHNAARLAATFGPVALALGARPLKVAWIVGAALLYLQWLPAVRAVGEAHGDPSVHAAFYEEVLEHVDGPVEIVFTRNHWEATHVAKHVPIARGWERQLDRKVNPLFYDDGPLTAGEYARWLRARGVEYVARPDAPLDFSAREEAALLTTPPRYLRESFSSKRWQIWKVDFTGR